MENGQGSMYMKEATKGLQKRHLSKKHRRLSQGGGGGTSGPIFGLLDFDCWPVDLWIFGSLDLWIFGFPFGPLISWLLGLLALLLISRQERIEGEQGMFSERQKHIQKRRCYSSVT